MSNVSTAKFLTAVNAVNPPEFSDQPDELPRIGWRNGAKQARTGGFFYAKADDLLDRPAAPWEPVTIYDDEPGYMSKRLNVAVISVRSQPFVPETDATGRKHMRWLAQWEPGAQIYTEWLCFAEGLGRHPVILYSKGLTGKALADALRTFRAKVLKPAERIAAPDPRKVAGLRSGLGLGDGPVAAYVGTLSQTTHNVGLLLEAFALVAARVPAARLLLVGDGEDRGMLEARAARLGLGPRVLFAGAAPYDLVPCYLALAACSVDPVADDPVARARSPLKIVESLAAGTPVVTGDVGDRAEVLGRDAGVLVAPGSTAALADGIVSLFEGGAPQASRVQARAADYRWDRLAGEWLKVYAGKS